MRFYTDRELAFLAFVAFCIGVALTGAITEHYRTQAYEYADIVWPVFAQAVAP